MIKEDKRLREYYISNKYKGFHKQREQNYKLSFSTHLTFSNGDKEIFASGYFKEEALKRIFDKIDKFHSNEKNLQGSDIEQQSFQHDTNLVKDDREYQN